MNSKKTGPKSLEEKTGEEVLEFKFKLTRSQYEWIMSQDVSASAYRRRLIMMSRALGDPEILDPNRFSHEVLAALNTILQNLRLTVEEDLSTAVPEDNNKDNSN